MKDSNRKGPKEIYRFSRRGSKCPSEPVRQSTSAGADEDDGAARVVGLRTDLPSANLQRIGGFSLRPQTGRHRIGRKQRLILAADSVRKF